jgi:hypothetical protein
VLVVAGATVWLPLGAFAPLHAPEAVHPVAFVAVHVRVDD